MPSEEENKEKEKKNESKHAHLPTKEGQDGVREKS